MWKYNAHAKVCVMRNLKGKYIFTYPSSKRWQAAIPWGSFPQKRPRRFEWGEWRKTIEKQVHKRKNGNMGRNFSNGDNYSFNRTSASKSVGFWLLHLSGYLFFSVQLEGCNCHGQLPSSAQSCTSHPQRPATLTGTASRVLGKHELAPQGSSDTL